MKVRCPLCKTVHAAPAPRFSCEGCGRALAWSPRPLWLAEQLHLFQVEGHGEPLTLPFTADVPPSTTRAAGPTTEPAAAPPDQQQQQLLDAIALITALRPVPGASAEVLPALLTDQGLDRLLGLATTTAWLASALVSLVDETLDGAGTAWLQGLAIGAAGG